MTTNDIDNEEILERREVSDSSDRRQKKTEFDENGFVNTATYTGPDRRSGLDRRDYQRIQNEKIMQEKIKILNHSILAFAFMTLSILVVAVFLLVPEVSKVDEFIYKFEEVKARMVDKIPNKFSLGGFINKQIAGFENVVKDVDSPIGKIKTVMSGYGGRPDIGTISNMMATLSSLRSDSGAETTNINSSLASLRTVIGDTFSDPESLKAVIKAARKYDKSLNKMLQGVDGNDVVAAAMLLTLNEFRSNVYTGRPYDADLSYLQKIAGDDPEIMQSLNSLAPYAKNGTMSTKTLKKEFGGLAKDIILAKVQGQDVSAKEQALKRFDNVVRHGNLNQTQRANEEAVIARAQMFLNSGDVQAALTELQFLETSHAQQRLSPWMNDAQDNVMANQASDQVMQAVLQNMGVETNGGGVIDLIKNSIGGEASSVYVSPALRH